LAAKVNHKLALFVKGRQQTLETLRKHISDGDQVIWLHAASLGEYEQGLPILEQLRLAFPDYKLLLTFFSPSGFEVKKNTPAADIVTYMPLDTKKKVGEFLGIANPILAIFIKYEIWPNYLAALKQKNIPTVLVSAFFKKEQIYFKWYGGFMRNVLKTFDHFYVQDKNSKILLNSIGCSNCDVTGDTRFDRVSKILNADNCLEFMDTFNTTSHCFIAGSTWPADEKLLVDYINSTDNDLKYVIAPHNIKKEHNMRLKESISKPSLLYSEIEGQNLSDVQVLIVDTIGLLTKIYSYASIAYVGGGFATGLHNTLEPAVFGIPVIIGPNYKGFKEAEDLVTLGGISSVGNKESLTKTINELYHSADNRNMLGQINSAYISKNKGASAKIMNDITKLLKN
jgi:3-deoxy-D-manno-octulosonic-acid transferase